MHTSLDQSFHTCLYSLAERHAAATGRKVVIIYSFDDERSKPVIATPPPTRRPDTTDTALAFLGGLFIAVALIGLGLSFYHFLAS